VFQIVQLSITESSVIKSPATKKILKNAKQQLINYHSTNKVVIVAENSLQMSKSDKTAKSKKYTQYAVCPKQHQPNMSNLKHWVT